MSQEGLPSAAHLESQIVTNVKSVQLYSNHNGLSGLHWTTGVVRHQPSFFIFFLSSTGLDALKHTHQSQTQRERESSSCM